jgi:hypothetical protein
MAAQGPLKVLEEAEKDKHRHYDRMAANQQAVFVPFAVESTGAIGKEALDWINVFIKAARRIKAVWAPRQDVYGIFRTVAIAVAKGNADIIEANMGPDRRQDL